MAARSLLLTALVAIAACAEWPRAQHLGNGGRPLPSTVDPATLFDVAWSDLVAVEPDDLAGLPGAAEGALALGAGLVVTGELAGIGYDLSAVSDAPSAPGCGTASPRSPVEGDYTGDVDHVVVDADEGTLCVHVALDAATDVAFDALLRRLDDCGLPGPAVEARGEVLGMDGVGGSADWHHFASAGRYAIQLAGWDPADDGRFVPWTMHVSLVDSKAGDDALCPAVEAP
jgi:hypothetical protein